MTGLERVKQVLIAIVVILVAIGMVLSPEDGLKLAMAIIVIACIIDGIRTLIYFFKMARYMVGGQIILYRGLIEMDLGLAAGFIINAHPEYIAVYLLGFYLLTGVFAIMRARESKNLGSRWRLKFASGIIDIAICVLCIVFWANGHTQNITYVYCFGLIESSILRVINAFKKTSVAYIQ